MRAQYHTKLTNFTLVGDFKINEISKNKEATREGDSTKLFIHSRMNLAVIKTKPVQGTVQGKNKNSKKIWPRPQKLII